MTFTKTATLRVVMTLALVFGALAVTAPSADAGPIDHLVDCNDSFWAIACGFDPAPPTDEVLGITVTRSDPGFSCSSTSDGYMICHSSTHQLQ